MVMLSLRQGAAAGGGRAATEVAAGEDVRAGRTGWAGVPAGRARASITAMTVDGLRAGPRRGVCDMDIWFAQVALCLNGSMTSAGTNPEASRSGGLPWPNVNIHMVAGGSREKGRDDMATVLRNGHE